MYLKIQLLIREIGVPKDSTLQFELTKPYPLIIQISNPPTEYINQFPPDERAISFCDVTTTNEPEGKIVKFFEKLQNQFTNSGPEPIDLSQIAVPIYCDEYVFGIQKDLMVTARNLIGLLRWTHNCLGPHNPFLHRVTLWSIDNIDWHPIPHPGKFSVFIKKYGRTLHIDQKGKSVIIDYLDRGISEPIYHELFREAWSLRDTDPKSSFVIGYESAEVGVKTIISKLIPPTEWLMNNIQYPPIDKILRDYLPSLPGIKKINNESIIPASIIKTVQKMMPIRNKQVHVGKEPPDSKEIESMLKDVQDLLLLLDYYCGFDFALSFVRPEKIQELEQPRKKK